MGYIVREANVLNDKDIMVNILINNRERKDYNYAERYNWLYLNNPVGPAKAWIIWNEETKEAAGFTGVFPREVYVQGKKYICWNCGDFSIEKKYRSLGVAIKLRKAAKECVDRGEVPFLYAHPNARMEVIHLKAGHFKIARMMRFALPIRANKTLQGKISPKWLANILSQPLNWALATKYYQRNSSDFSYQLNNRVQCSVQHEGLFKKMIEQYLVIGSRDGAFLNWKFGQNPNLKVQQFDLYEKDTLSGSIFFLIGNGAVLVLDVLIGNTANQVEMLFRTFVTALLKEMKEVSSISFIVQEFNPLLDALKRIGFRYRDDATSAVISYANEQLQPDLSKVVLNGRNWFMSVGDRDA